MVPLHAGIMILLGSVLLAVIIGLIVRGHLRVAHALLWLMIALAFMASPLLYAFFDHTHTRQGWPAPAFMLLLLGFAFLLVQLLYQTLELSKGWRQRKKNGPASGAAGKTPGRFGKDAAMKLPSLFRRSGTTSCGVRCLAALVGILLGAGWTSFLFWKAHISSGVARYADSNLPMLGSPDSWFFLYQTHDMIEHGLRFDSLTALSTLLAAVHKVVCLPPETTGFWLPFVFALASGLVFALWAGLFRLSPAATGVAALTGMLVPAWSGRVKIGSLDTDGGIFFLWGLCLYLAAKLTLPAHSLTLKQKVRLGLLFLGCAALLCWFWRSGLLLVPMSLWLWALTWHWANAPSEKRVRKALAFALPLMAALLLSLPDSLLPVFLAESRTRLADFISMVLNPDNALIFQSISELWQISPRQWLMGLGGGISGGLIALAALAAMAARHPRQTLLLAPFFAMLALGFFSNRFLFFASLPVGLAAALLPLTVPVLLRRVRKTKRAIKAGRLLGGCLLCVILYQQCEMLRHDLGGGALGRGEDKIAIALRTAIEQGPQDSPAALFHWWDEGYFLRYRTGVEAFFDGSSQNPLPAFLAAFPMASDNPELARRWIRYFALHKGKGTGSHKDENGGEGWEPLVQSFGSEERAFRELVTLFCLPEEKIDAHLQTWPELPGLPEAVPLRDWLFPQGRVFLFQPLRFLSLAPWWMAMGAGPKSGPLRKHLEPFAAAAFSYDPATNKALLPPEVLRKGLSQAGAMYLPRPEKPFTAPWGGDRPEPLLIVPQHSPFGYLVSKAMARSLAFRLLAPSWEQIPGFKRILVNLSHAGAWEVLP